MTEYVWLHFSFRSLDNAIHIYWTFTQILSGRCVRLLFNRLITDDFLNMPKIFQPFQDSSGFSEGVTETSEKAPKQCSSLFVLRQTMWFWISVDWLIWQNKVARIGGLTPLKKTEREACVSQLAHVHWLDVSFVISQSVGANGFSYFLFLLFCSRKWINLKTFGVGKS